MANQLIHESSPYLLQHAHNPVHWHPWGEAALNKAQVEDKPILISIGYAACHWCHVMEKESFENETLAAYMNKYFVNIKIDREERPDLDQIYMEAVTTLTGSGGWPLNCFLTPDGRPFYGGTYFPPEPKYGRVSWLQVLQHMVKIYAERREEVEQQANQLTYHIASQDKTFFKTPIIDFHTDTYFERANITKIFKQLQGQFDTENGGFGGAPKFPSTMAIHFLFHYYYRTGKLSAKQHALFSIDQMIYGGIYDQIGGGFARYTVDEAWLVPHFEKMLYDNALLIGNLATAYQLTKEKRYSDTIKATLAFVERDMLSQEGGFYAAYDADSEGIEGKYYVWDKAEIDRLLGDDAPFFNAFYDVSETGNWEHKNILNRSISFQEFAQIHDVDVNWLKTHLKDLGEKLLRHRQKRVKPALDDKIILSWNALMCSAFFKAYQALQIDNYLTIAVNNLQFMLQKYLIDEKNPLNLHHTYKNQKGQYPAFLDDYAFLIAALLDAYSTTFDQDYIQKAKQFTDYVLVHFYDETGFGFFYTSNLQKDILLRKKEFYDNALPSGNSTMVNNLLRLSVYLEEKSYKETALLLLKSMEDALVKYPRSFANWAINYMTLHFGIEEVVVVGKNANTLGESVNTLFMPEKIMQVSQVSNEQFPLLKGRFQENKTQIYLCQNETCQMPVETLEDFEKNLIYKQ
ncbi:MAG: thioredoxin domain-containing protein [Chitinophagales bacterium]